MELLHCSKSYQIGPTFTDPIAVIIAVRILSKPARQRRRPAGRKIVRGFGRKPAAALGAAKEIIVAGTLGARLGPRQIDGHAADRIGYRTQGAAIVIEATGGVNYHSTPAPSRKFQALEER